MRLGPSLSAAAAGEPAASTARRATITSGISEDRRNQFTRHGSRPRRVNSLPCRKAGEPAPTAYESELGVLCAAHDRSAQCLTRTESALGRPGGGRGC